MNNPDTCTHDVISFGSGDYYLTCEGCQRHWVHCGKNDEDVAWPDGANNSDPQRNLSGELRYALRRGLGTPAPPTLQEKYGQVKLCGGPDPVNLLCQPCENYDHKNCRLKSCMCICKPEER